MTRRKPSSTSRSFLLSSNFFICAAGICLAVRLPAPASRAASSVRSRAASCQNPITYLQGLAASPVSSMLEMREIDSMIARVLLAQLRYSTFNLQCLAGMNDSHSQQHVTAVPPAASSFSPIPMTYLHDKHNESSNTNQVDCCLIEIAMSS